MPSLKRPYFRSRLKELRKLFGSHQNDPVMLAALAEELGHRKRPAAASLYREVQHRLDRLRQQKAAPTREAAQADLPLPHPERRNDPSAVPLSPLRVRPQPLSDDHLRPPQQLRRIKPLGVAGRPPKYARNPKTDVALDLRAGMPRTARYAVALGALISDMRRQRQGTRQITLEDGNRIPLDRGHIGYSFAFTEDADLFEDACVGLRVGGRTIDGHIVSISGGKIIIAAEDDLGETVARCILVIDNTALLESLKERLEKAGGEGRALNTKLADSVVSNSGEALPEEFPLPSGTFTDENAGQKRAVHLALANEVTYLWGPPGTGKTKTLSILIKELFDREKRVLICSNTNQAVDQVLLILCKKLGKDHPAMEKGQIVRLGRIAHEELSREYAEYVTLDGIVERRSRDLQERKRDLEASLESIARRVAATEATLGRFAQLDSVRAAIVEANRQVAQLRNDSQSAVRRRDDAKRCLVDLDRKLERTRTAGALRRLFLRSEKTVVASIEKTKAALAAADLDAARLLDLITASKEKSDELVVRRDDVARSLGTADRAGLERQMEAFASERQPLLDELAGLNKALADIEAAVMRDATVIGATVTKAYLSAKGLPAFDVVVIDEASMVLLPALYFAVGLAREKAVVSGDFRQLPPIVQTEQKAILDEIGMDVFHAAGVVEAVDASGDPRLVMLEEQYRMHKAICGLISGFMYKGRLRTSASVDADPIQPWGPLSGHVAIIDTSSLWPFETQTSTFSRYNLVHALVVRNLIRQLHEAVHVKDSGALGICTPYAAQAKLLRRLIEDEDDLKKIVEAGTVHRYQGDEKTAIIIDIPESVGGGRSIGRFLQGDHDDDDGAKLLNVAVSRAKQRLVIVANLTYLDDRLPGGALLRDILFQIQTSGQVLDAREILSLQSADLRGLGRPVDIDLETQRTGLFKQKDFDTVFRADVTQAKASVVILSGFVTPERVGSYGDLFRQKILEGAKIRCVTRPPQYNGSIPSERGKEALDALEGIGVVVDCRRDIHQKIAIIDGRVVWFGSLNPLSHTARTDEIMMRVLAPGFASELARLVAIRRVRRGDDGAESAAAEGENPRCGKCGGRTFYFWSNRLRRPFFACEAECSPVQDATSTAAGQRPQQPTDDLPADGPPCPKCGQTTRLRRGRHGAFYGCPRYPKCDGTMSARQALDVLSSDGDGETRTRV